MLLGREPQLRRRQRGSRGRNEPPALANRIAAMQVVSAVDVRPIARPASFQRCAGCHKLAETVLRRGARERFLFFLSCVKCIFCMLVSYAAEDLRRQDPPDMHALSQSQGVPQRCPRTTGRCHLTPQRSSHRACPFRKIDSTE